MSYTLGQAAKATGKSKTTIQRSISKGLISAVKGSNGRYEIDPSELHRVFPAISSDTVSKPSHVDVTQPLSETLIQTRLEATEAMLDRERDALMEMRQDRDAWKQQATALLSAPVRKQPGWFDRILGRK